MKLLHLTTLVALAAGAWATEQPAPAAEPAPAPAESTAAESTITLEQAENLIKTQASLINQLADAIEQATPENAQAQADKIREIVAAGRALEADSEKITPQLHEQLAQNAALIAEMEQAETRLNEVIHAELTPEKESVARVLVDALLDAATPPTATEPMTEQTAAMANELARLWNEMAAVFEQATPENVASQAENLKQLDAQLQALQQQISQLSPQQIAALDTAPALAPAMERLAAAPTQVTNQQVLDTLAAALTLDDVTLPAESAEEAPLPSTPAEPLAPETQAFVDKALAMMNSVAEVVEQTTPDNLQAQIAKLAELQAVADALRAEMDSISLAQRNAVENSPELMQSMAAAESRIDNALANALAKLFEAGQENLASALLDAMNPHDLPDDEDDASEEDATAEEEEPTLQP